MRLLVDVGNSRIKWQITTTCGTARDKGAYAHNGSDPGQWVDTLWQSLERPASVIIANVAGAAVADALSDWIRRHWALDAVFAISRSAEFGVRNGYECPSQLGVDRWLALIGARQITHHPCAVIDCGTAVTADAMTATGQHIGGVILPGVRLMHAALLRNTALTIDEPPQDIVMLGRTTRDCVWGGTVHAIAAAIDRISDYMARQPAAGEPFLRLLTGGNAGYLLPHLHCEYRLEPGLIFTGLHTVASQTATAPENS